MKIEKTGEFILDHERSLNLEDCLDYEISSFPAPCVQMEKLVEQLYDDCQMKLIITATSKNYIKRSEKQIRKNLTSLLWHLFRILRSKLDIYLRISQSSRAYIQKGTQNPHHITRHMAPIIKCLTSFGYLDMHIGFLCGHTGKTRETRIRVKPKLLQLLHSIPMDLSEQYVDRPSVQFKKKRLGKTFEVEYNGDSEMISRAQHVVNDLNFVLTGTRLRLRGVNDDIAFYRDSSGVGRYIDLTRTHMRSLFYVEESGQLSYGRVHGGFWQYMPKKYRSLITINGEKTVELDYSAQIVNIVASLEKKQLGGDPYKINFGLGGLSQNLERNLAKHMIVTMLNSDSIKQACAATRSEFRQNKIVLNSPIRLKNDFLIFCYDQIFERHPYLESYAFRGQGKKLFMYDADVARKVIEVFTEQRKAILPIHDGFVVAEADETLLRSSMLSVWHDMFGTSICVKREE